MKHLFRNVFAFVILVTAVGVAAAQSTQDSLKAAQKAMQRVSQLHGDTLTAEPATAAVQMPVQETIGSKFKSEVVYGVGVQAGLLSGSGIIARMHLPNRMGAQFGFGVIGLGDNTYWDIGGEFQYTFDSDSKDRLYGLAGLGYYYTSTSDSTSGNELGRPFRIGLGVGYEWFLGSRLVVNASLPIIVFLGDERTQIFPLPQVGLVYYFQ